MAVHLLAWTVTSRRLRDFGVGTGRQWLAVTVAKADLLAGLPPAIGTGLPVAGRR